ncbi:MAG: hypothetical protein M1499_01895, partial [Firmicutes bacterium]|nr:hypothetical protein [Bacillota bacterium]
GQIRGIPDPHGAGFLLHRTIASKGHGPIVQNKGAPQAHGACPARRKYDDEDWVVVFDCECFSTTLPGNKIWQQANGLIASQRTRGFSPRLSQVSWNFASASFLVI